MKRDILRIDEELCNGCGQCIPNCHEGALKIINGKAKLISEVMCDGLGACIGHCPEGAITIESREAERFDEKKVIEMMKNSENQDHQHQDSERGCPGSRERVIEKSHSGYNFTVTTDQTSELRHWPVQMHLLNPNAPFLRDSDLLLAADCVAFSLGNFHSIYLKGKSLAIACPKLDHDLEIYVEKLTGMIDIAKVNTITVMMMEVPCCGGLMQMVKAALAGASRKIPVKQLIISLSGSVLKDEWV